MTDDEIKAAIASLKPKTNWGQVIAVALTAAGSVWAATQYLGELAKRSEVNGIRDDVVRIRLDQTTMSGRVERVEQSQARVEKAIERVESKLADEPKRRR